MKKRRIFGAALTALLTLAGLATAQETTSGSVTGLVTDAQGAAIPGATVTLTSTQGAKTTTTDSQGRFFSPYLVPGKYSLRVEISGFAPITQKSVDVRLGARLDLGTLALKVGGRDEVVEVVGNASAIDTSSTTAGGVLDSDMLKRLPVGRNFTDALYLVPGVSNSGVGRSNPSMSGGSGLENNYVVDGVNITNTGYGAVGSYSIVFGSLGAGVTSDFVKETQVKSAGFEAEYGESTGGVVNVITQSGTNAFHGSAFGFFAPPALESSWRNLQSPNGTVNTTDQNNRDFGLSVGGPLMKDKIFFFGTFNPQYQTRTFIAPSNYPLVSLGEIDRKRRILSYAGKLSWQANSNHRFEVSAFGDPSTGENGPQRANLLRNNSTKTNFFSELSNYGGHNQSIRYDGIISPAWLVEASFAHAKNSIAELPSQNDYSISDATVSPSVTTGGIGFYEQGNVGRNKQFQLKSTNIFNGGGNHQLRYGVLYEDINYDNINQYTGAPITLANGVKTTTGVTFTIVPDASLPGGRLYRVTRGNYVNVRETTTKYLSLFMQDTWQVGKKLTLRPGVRYERQRLVGSPTPVICHEDDSQPGAADGTGAGTPCQYTFDNNWGPRLGATYDIMGNGKSKLYASFGRFYAKIPNDLAARALSSDAGITRADYFDAGLTQPIPNGQLAGGQTVHLLLAGVGASLIDPTTKSTKQDEFVGGAEFEVAHNVSVGARYIHRNMDRVNEDIGNAAMVLFDLGTPGLASVEYFITNPREGYPATFNNVGAFENVVHKYDSVELTATKAFADNWSLNASYRWSRLNGNFEGFYRNDNGQSDPAISSLFDFPTNDPSYTQIGTPQFGYRGDIRYLGCTLGCGQLPNDRTHQLKLYGSYAISAVNLGIGFTAGSGKPLTALAANPNYGSGGEIPEGVRGSGITSVDGFTDRSPMETQIDVHADYTVKFGSQRLLFMADVFNLINRQEAQDYDNWTQRSITLGTNLNYGLATNGGNSAFTSYQAPRQIRLGARFEW